jgi:hypothetical protein
MGFVKVPGAGSSSKFSSFGEGKVKEKFFLRKGVSYKAKSSD